MPTQLTIWTNAELTPDGMEELQRGCQNHRLILATKPTSNLGAALESPELEQANIAFGQPDPGQVISLQKLQWVHITSAGYTRYDRPDLQTALQQRKAQLTNSSSVYDEPCAQHLLALMLARARCLPQAIRAQVVDQSWTYPEVRPISRVLEKESVLLLGYGAIARRLVQLLKPFDLEIKAVRRTVKGDEEIPTFPETALNELLPNADYIVSTLPASPATEKFFNQDRIAKAKPGAVFYNIGRGTTVDQPALIAALNNKHLAGAYLDVVDPEPLPPDHPLWTTPNCWITPHDGGGRQDEYVHLARHFIANLRRFEQGQSLLDRVF
jgi:phosphoglycerate dehydrogenase-like enzyme